MGAGHFPYPVALTTLHLLFQTLATRVLHRYTDLVAPPSPEYASLPLSEGAMPPAELARRTRLAKDAAVDMDWPTWRRQM